MQQDDGLITAYILDGKGSGEKIGWDDLLSWKPGDGVLWVHLDYSVKSSRQWLVNNSGLSGSLAQSLMVEESRPRAVIEPDGLLLFLRGVNLNPGHDVEDMVSIRIWLDKNKVITTRKRKLLSVKDLEAAIQNNKAPKTTAELVTMLSERLTEKMSDVVEKNSDALDELEETGDREKITYIRKAISELRRQAIMIKRYLSPQRDAFNRLLVDQDNFFNPVDLILLREVSDRVQRCIEELDATRDRAAVMQEEVSTRLSEQINSRMYMLSLVAVIFLPLGFIAGLLGINVGGIPGAQYKYAFWLVTGGLVLLGLSLVVIFRRRKWF